MKAIVQDKYGSADVLEFRDIEKPVAGDDDLLVRVHAAGVDPGVWHLMTGRPYLVRMMGFGFGAPKIRVRGMDAAGTVEAAGKKVTQFKAGDVGPATAPSPSTFAPRPSDSAPNPRTSPSNKPPPYLFPP